jgi:hypothetical protein
MSGYVWERGYTARECYKSVGKGWSSLIRTALKYKPKDTKIVQVKEKFGTLRIYHEPYTEKYEEIINILEYVSAHTCEHCGKPGRLDKRYPWCLTLCVECRKERWVKKEGKRNE